MSGGVRSPVSRIDGESKKRPATARGSSDSPVTLECFITGGPRVFSSPRCVPFLLPLSLFLCGVSFFFPVCFFSDRSDARLVGRLEWPQLLRGRQKFS